MHKTLISLFVVLLIFGSVIGFTRAGKTNGRGPAGARATGAAGTGAGSRWSPKDFCRSNTFLVSAERASFITDSKSIERKRDNNRTRKKKMKSAEKYKNKFTHKKK